MSINELCNEGNSQSPINIDTENLKGCSSTCDIQFFYRNSKCKLLMQEIQSIIQKTKKDKMLTLEYDAGSYITMNHDIYNLDTISFNIPSIHTVNKFSYPIEMNLHHKSASSGKMLILSIFVDISNKQSISAEFFNLFEKKIPSSGQLSINTPEEWNIFNCIPKIKNFYMYHGSLPRNPCTEDILWIIMEHHITCNELFYNNLKKVIGNNKIRPIQKLNNRIVYYNSSIQDSRNYGNKMKCYTDQELRKRCAELSSNVEVKTFNLKKNLYLIISIVVVIFAIMIILFLRDKGYLKNILGNLHKLFDFKILKQKKIINQ